MKGFFITFEGLEGSGKTTQALRLFEALKEKGYSVVSTREPGGTVIGNALRGILLNHEHREMNPLTELLIVSAARAQHIAQLIRPMLDEGSVVICDRFYDSTLAYQGFGRGLPPTTVREITSVASWNTQPDFTVYLDMDVEKAIGRMRHRIELEENIPDRMEREDRDFYERVRVAYQDIGRDEPGRFRVFNGDQDPAILHEKILDKVLSELRKRNISNKLTPHDFPV